MLAQAWGPGEAGWEKVTRVLANTKVLNRSSLVFQGVGNGEFPLGMSLEYAGYQWASNGAPVKVDVSGGRHGRADGRRRDHHAAGRTLTPQKPFVDYVTRKDVREAILQVRFSPAGARRPRSVASCRARCRSSPTSSSSTTMRTAGPRGAAETMQKIQDLIRRTR